MSAMYYVGSCDYTQVEKSLASETNMYIIIIYSRSSKASHFVLHRRVSFGEVTGIAESLHRKCVKHSLFGISSGFVGSAYNSLSIKRFLAFLVQRFCNPQY